MYKEAFAARQLDQNVFRTPGDGFNTLACKTAGKIVWEGKPQVGAIGADLSDAAALHGPGEALGDRFNLGKLRHWVLSHALNG